MIYKVVLRILRETSTAKYQSVIVARVPSRMATGGQTSDVATKIAKNLVQNVRTKESVAIETMWSDKPAVIMFMRRFG